MQNENDILWKKEAEVFSHYLVGMAANREAIELYIEASRKLSIFAPLQQKTALNFVLRHPSFLPAIDGALSIRNHDHVIRKKLYLMFAILESSPAFCNYFLPQERKDIYLFKVIWTGVCAAINTIYGFIILLWI